jgi:hypothetical protein
LWVVYLYMRIVAYFVGVNLRVGNLPTRRLDVRFVCYLIVIKSLSFRYQMGLTPRGWG